MFEFMKCVVEGIAANGVHGLLEFVPGGKYIHDVGAYAVKRHREKRAQKKLEDDAKEMIAAQADVAFAAAKQAVEEAAPQLPAREKELVLQFVSAMPEAARQSFKRKDDPTGTSLPFGYTIHEPLDVVKLLPTHPPRFLPGEWVPGREDNWRLERRIGGGGFGEVWLARHHFNRKEKPRAVKFCTDPVSRQKLITHEKQVIERVMRHVGHHDNIVPLLECRLSGETPWLMYEFVEGGTLAAVILEWRKLTPAERLNRAIPVLHTIASAVGCGHAVTPAVVHRDLKPANVLMAGAVPRITDYGIGGAAVAFQVAEEKTRGYTTVMGRLPSMLSGSYSLLYSSPQQRDGDPPDPRDDVHALGVLAYQILTGRLDAEVKGNWQKRLKADGTPEALIDLIGDSASDEADDRPHDARGWEKALADLLPEADLVNVPVAPPPAVVPRAVPVPVAPKPTVRTPGEVVEFPLPGGLKMAFCWIPPGRATLGSPVNEKDRKVDEKEHGFTTKGFWLGKCPVTQAEWYALTGETPSYFQSGGGGAAEVGGLDTTRFPVEQVSWGMCQTFLEKLNALGGTEKAFGKAIQFALPHEDAWEYACRGGLGNQQPFYFGNDLNGTQANIDGTSPFGTTSKGPHLKRPTAVGSYAAKVPHPWGLCDMHGNVWEWCENLYKQRSSRVFRGGSWRNGGHRCRTAYRNGRDPDFLGGGIGVRLCLPWTS